MRDLTKDQFDILERYREPIEEARTGSFRAFPMSDALQLNEVYAYVYGEGENMTCGKCILTMLQGLAVAYDRYIVKEGKVATDPLKTQNKGIPSNGMSKTKTKGKSK